MPVRNYSLTEPLIYKPDPPIFENALLLRSFLYFFLIVLLEQVSGR